MTWPTTDTRLESRYRRLLLAHPGRDRRTEMLTTLLDMAAPGQTRPATADAWHLITAGIRQRFRLPAGRPLPWAAAVLITLILGGFGAAAGSWAAAQTFAEPPGDTAFAALITTAAGGPVGELTQTRADSPWWGTDLYGSAESPGWTAGPARHALTTAGWQLGPDEVRVYDEPGSTTTYTRFLAHRDGLAIQVTGLQPGPTGHVSVDAWATDNGTLLPLIITGGLAGLLLGWPLTAAAAYRVRRLPPTRARAAATLTGLGIAALALPAVAFYGNVMRAVQAADRPWIPMTVHSALNPGPYYPFGPPWIVLALTLAGLVPAAAALITLLPRPVPAAIPTTS